MNYYDKYGVLLAPSKSWEYTNYGFKPEGMGDCITNTMYECLQHLDKWSTERITDYWAVCHQLLSERKRWPDELNNERVAKSKPREWWSKLIQTPWRPCLYRPQDDITRDPFTYYRALDYMLFGHGEALKPPVIWKWRFLYRPHIWAWFRYLKTGKGKKWYLLLERIGKIFPTPEYAKKMQRVRLNTINTKP